MNSDAISKRDHSEVFVRQFRDDAPESASVVHLQLGSDRAFDNLSAPLLFQIWSLAEDFLKEVIGKPVFGHPERAWGRRSTLLRLLRNQSRPPSNHFGSKLNGATSA